MGYPGAAEGWGGGVDKKEQLLQEASDPFSCAHADPGRHWPKRVLGFCLQFLTQSISSQNQVEEMTRLVHLSVFQQLPVGLPLTNQSFSIHSLLYARSTNSVSLGLVPLDLKLSCRAAANTLLKNNNTEVSVSFGVLRT